MIDWLKYKYYGITWSLQGYTDMTVDPSGAIVPDYGQFLNNDITIKDALIYLGFGYLALAVYSEFRSPTKKNWNKSVTADRSIGGSYGKGSFYYGRPSYKRSYKKK